MRRRPGRDPGFPVQLATFDPADWLEPDDSVLRPVFRLVRAWSRWLESRTDWLLLAGYTVDRAQELGYGDLPGGLVNEAVRLGNSASTSPGGPPQSGAVGSQGHRAVPTFPPP